MTEIKVLLVVVIVLAVTLAVLYRSPFAACHGCPGRSCRRCRGLGRYQRQGSRTVHHMARSVRKEIERTRAERRDDHRDRPGPV
jgi:hypothetical protein